MQPLKINLIPILVVLSTFVTNTINAQVTKDTLLSEVRYRFEVQEGYTFGTAIQSVNTRNDGLPPDVETACPSGKEMLVVAVFGTKPNNLFARMLVAKHFGKKTAYDEHLFQPATFEGSLHIWYSLVQVQFPAEANSLNCGVNLQVFDKDKPEAKVWLLTFSK